MRFAIAIGIHDAVFESDALGVINAVQGIAALSSSTQFIVDGILQQACMFRSCCFTHIKSTRSRCAKCQIFGTFNTPNIKMKLYQMFQMVKIIPHMNSTVANLQRYGQKWYKFY